MVPILIAILLVLLFGLGAVIKGAVVVGVILIVAALIGAVFGVPYSRRR